MNKNSKNFNSNWEIYSQTDKKQSFFKRLRPYFTKSKKFISWFISTILLGISGLWAFKDQLHELSTPNYKLFNEKNYEHGVYIPANITSNYPEIRLSMGSSIGQIMSLSDLPHGIPFEFDALKIGEAPHLTFTLNGQFLYVSTTFYDINTMQYLGRMDANTWEVKNTIAHYKDTNGNLEILDPNGNVMFNMIYTYPNKITIRGYFILDDQIIIYCDGLSVRSTNDPDDYMKAKEEIKSIPKLNTYDVHM